MPRLLLRRLLISALATLVSLVFGLGALEVGFRLVRWRSLRPPMQPEDPVYHHRLPPHFQSTEITQDFHVIQSTNNLGLRGTTDYAPAPPPVLRGCS